MSDRITFKPVRGFEEELMNIPVTEGLVLFATDTGKMWMDTRNERVSLGGSGASLIYAQSTPQAVADDDGNYFYIISPDDLDEPELKVQINDLILNSDGSFYRVVELLDDGDYRCSRVTVSGTGGGGNVSLGKAMTIKGISLPTYTLVNGQSMSAKFTATSAISADGEVEDDELTIVWTITDDDTGIVYDSGNFKVDSGVQASFEFGSRLRDSSSSTLTVYAVGTNSGTSKKITFPVTTVELMLYESEKFSNLAPYGPEFTMYCNISGNIEKILDFYLDGELVNSQTLGRTNIGEQKFTISNVSHGYHTVSIDLYQSVGGERGVGVKTPLEFEIAVNDGVSKDPIVWLGKYASTFYNYDSIKIPYKVFNPVQNETNVIFVKGVAELDHRIAKSNSTSFDIYEITDATLDLTNVYYIRAEKSEVAEDAESKYVTREIQFKVEQDPNRDMTLTSKENLLINFDAAGRSNTQSETQRQTLNFTIGSGSGARTVSAKFDNFNWYNNGWILDDDNNTCLRISNGAQFSIPIGHMIMNDANSTANQSRTFEFQFKIRNVQDYSNLIKEYTRYSGDQAYWAAFTAQWDDPDGYDNYDAFLKYVTSLPDSTTTYDKVTEKFSDIYRRPTLNATFCRYYDNSGHGLCLGPQDGFFSSAVNTVNVKYVEDKLINLTIVFSYTDKRIYMYLQGILTAVSNIKDTGALTIAANEIVFNSEFCDVDLYKFRIYNGALSVADILTNFSVDHKSVIDYDHTKQLISYNQNTGEYQLNFSAVEEWNKDADHLNDYLMPYVIFETPVGEKLPYSKANKKKVIFTFVNTGLERAYATGELEELANNMPQAQKDAAEKEGLTLVEYYYKHHCPSFTSITSNVSLAVQGTSSEFYPRRNYKAKTKGTILNSDGEEEDYIYMFMNRGPFAKKFTTDPELCQLDFFYYNNYTVGTTKFTMKIDYMESSGTYNMGLANLVNNAYTKHPFNDYNTAGAFHKQKFEKSQDAAPVEGKTYYVDSKGKTKAKFNDELVYAPDTFYEAKYDPYTFSNLEEYRTNVQGFPVMAFWKNGTNYQFIGRYNMLSDKGSDETYGFKPSKSITAAFKKDKAVRKIVECWEYSDNNRGYCSFRDPMGRHKLSFDMFKDDGTRAMNSKGSCPIVADSYEYRYHADADLLDYMYDPETNGDVYNDLLEDYTATQLADLDWRSNTMFDIYANWEKACQWVYSTCTDNVPSETDPDYQSKARLIMKYESAAGQPFDESTVYYNETEDIIEDPQPQIIKTPIVSEDEVSTLADESGTIEETPTENDENVNVSVVVPDGYYIGIPTPVQYDDRTYEYDTKEYRRAKFTNELQDHFDLEYLLVYFVMTEVLLCYDSRGKNCMMASWGPQKAGGDYIWYPVFYDMDTQLGINNTGIPSFEYSVNASLDGCFSTSDSVLWNNLFTCFFENIKSKYFDLRNGFDTLNKGHISKPPLYNVDHIEKWYLADPTETDEIEMRGARPLAMFNMDEFFKYISICNPNIQYQNRQGGMDTDTSGTYFYALQGDRSLSRQQFLARRINFIDSWMSQGDYSRDNGTEIHGRIGANNPEQNSDKWVSGPSANDAQGIPVEGIEVNVPYKQNYLDADAYVDLTPYQKSYVTIGIDNAALPSKEYEDEAVRYDFTETVINGIKNSARYPEQLLYIYGAASLKDVGDISKLYWSEFYAKNSTHLSRLLLGSDAPGFYNYGLKSPDFDAMKAPGAIGKPLLKEVNLTGLRLTADSITDFDFTSSEKMQIFKALRSNITSVTFADGVALHTLYLPSSVTTLKLTEAANLNKVIRSINDDPKASPEDYYSKYNQANDTWTVEKGLYISGLTDLNEDDITDSTICNLAQIDIAGDHLGYGSYEILHKLYKLYKLNGKELKVSLTNVDWSPYKKLDADAVYDSAKSYWVDDNHYGFKAYTYTNIDSWKLALKNGEIYEYNATLGEANENTITDIQMLIDFINYSNFKNTTSSGASVPVITGDIYVNNSVPVDEDYIRNSLLINSAFPAEKLNIHFKNVTKGYSARFIQLEPDGTYKVIGTQVIGISQSATKFRFDNPYTVYEAKRDNYDFHGWSTTNSNDNVIPQNEWANSELTKIRRDESNNPIYDYTFYAVFTRHKFTISFQVGTDATGFTNIQTDLVPFGDLLRTPAILPSMDESELPDDRRYRFVGWVQEKKYILQTNANKFKGIINVDGVFSTADLTFFASFIEESVFDSVIDNKYLKFSSTTYTDVAGDSSKNLTGYMVSVATYRDEEGIERNYKLSGKITLPSVYNNAPVVKIAASGFSDQTELTHVFFDSKAGEPRLKMIDEYAFNGCSNLKMVDFPKTVRYLNKYAFGHCQKFAMFDFNWDDLVYIEYYTFHSSYEYVTQNLYIGGNVSVLGERAWNNCNATFKEVIIGDKQHPSQLLRESDIGIPAIRSTERPIQKITIYCSGEDLSYFNTIMSKTSESERHFDLAGYGPEVISIVTV